MRIVAGRHRGLALSAPEGTVTRPTSERARQALFDMLSHGRFRGVLDGAVVADLFAGTGALGLEALSRGARSAAFVETDRAALASLRANLRKADREDDSQVLASDATALPPRRDPFTLLFLDAPYGQDMTAAALASAQQRGWIGPETLVVAQIDPGEATGWLEQGWTVEEDRRHGKARLLIVRPRQEP